MKNKKILFFAPNFFGYELEIKSRLESLGAIVDLYDDRPSNSTFSKILIRLNPKLMSIVTHKYFKNIINSNNKKYDFVFFIKCEAALESDLQRLRERFNCAKFILYLYDSTDNIKYFDIKRKYFDDIYSFDTIDVQEKKLKFVPLFYLPHYRRDYVSRNNKYDLSFIGTAHSDRPKIINSLRKIADLENKSHYFRLYESSKFVFYIKRLLNNDFNELYKNGNITLKKLDAITVSEIIENSNCVVDIQHPKQHGLTMRTIELVGMQRKIITTNSSIKRYDFYKKENVAIIDRENASLPYHFLNTTYIPVERSIYDSYYIDNWILNIFNQYERSNI